MTERTYTDDEENEISRNSTTEEWFTYLREKDLHDRMANPPKIISEVKYMNVVTLPHFGDLELPQHQTRGASGIDLRATSDGSIAPGTMGTVATGLCIEVFRGYEAQIRSRSGLAFKNQVFVLNSPGTIDSDYRGELMVMLMNMGDQRFYYQRGDRVAQMVITPYLPVELRKVEELSSTTRGQNGFGSTGV